MARRQAATCKNGHQLAGENVWVGTQRKFVKRLQAIVNYQLRICRLCRRREECQ